jgi:DNA-binding XRE family transcriptional regulator
MKFSQLKEKVLNDPETKKAYENIEGEYEAMRALHLARIESGLSQVELASASNVPQKTISKIESGSVNTTVNTLAKIARGLGKTIKIEFV